MWLLISKEVNQTGMIHVLFNMINKIHSSKRKASSKATTEMKYPIPAAHGANAQNQEYFENRVRKTLRLNVVAVKLANLLKR